MENEIVIQCIQYIKNNVKDIASNVDDEMYESEKYIKEQIINFLKTNIKPNQAHYKLEYDGCPYDYSGVLKEDGVIEFNQTVNEFLNNEYSGSKEATFESFHGWRYNTYGDELRYLTLEIGSDILRKRTREQLETAFKCKIDDNDFDDIMFECYDIVYDESIVHDFFSWELPIEFIGIGDEKISTFITQ